MPAPADGPSTARSRLSSSVMDPPSCLAAAGYDGRLARWATLAPAAWLAEVNLEADARGLVSSAGVAIRFRFDGPGEVRRSALDYERQVHDEGQVVCRRDPDGFEHDRWNAAVWLTWPRTKAALNRLHARDPGPGGPGPGRRSRRRDLATLVDESGLAWVSARPDCDRLLAERCWRSLFIDRREDLVDGVVPLVIGHGLIGKLKRPYKRLTAQTLVVPVAASLLKPLAHDAVDAAIASRLIEVAGSGRCLPLPVLALPGWCDDNRDPAFFDDPTVFRPRPATASLKPADGSTRR